MGKDKKKHKERHHDKKPKKEKKSKRSRRRDNSSSETSSDSNGGRKLDVNTQLAMVSPTWQQEASWLGQIGVLVVSSSQHVGKL